MSKRVFAILLALALLLAALPATAAAASAKSATVKGRSAGVSVTDDGVWLNIKWDKVSGATGYEYAYNLFWKKDSKQSDYTFRTTDANGASIRLSDYGAVDIRVRAFKKVRGKTIYGAWTSGRLKRSQLDKLIVKQLKKRMKSKNLFLKATSNTVNVRTGAGEQYGVVAKMNRLDEARATGRFKRDSEGVWWCEVYAGIDQNTTLKGWVSRKTTEAVWY